MRNATKHLGTIDNASYGSQEAADLDPNWERIEAVVDSGACNHVCPKTIATSFRILETEASKKGAFFTGADGSKMQNLGCKDITAVTDTNSATSLRIQIAENVN